MRAAILPFLMITGVAAAQPYGIEPPRQANTQLLIFEPPAEDGSTSFPLRLSDNPALLAAASGEGHTIPGIIPFQPAAPLWSDNAGKERYMAIPGLEQIGFRESGGWDFPEHTVLIKNFALPLDERAPEASLKRIETRLLWKHEGNWLGYSYEWNDEETDGTLLWDSKSRPFTITTADGSTLDYEWYYPSQSDCRSCHTRAANFVLGPSTPQLNSDLHYPASGVSANQVESLEYVSIFSGDIPPTDSLPRMVDYRDAAEPLDVRARSYLAANCSPCHQPGAPNPAQIDLRFETALAAMNAVGVFPNRGEVDLADPLIIAPGEPDRSVLLARMASHDSIWRMPPLASSRIDEAGVTLIREWILSLGENQNNADGWVVY